MAQELILIVEDEVIVAMDIQRGLKRLGYSVVGITSNGKDALAKIEAIRPNLILMDIQIQGELDGVETAKLVWSRFRLPVIFLTAYADKSTLKRAKSAESFGYILKPFEDRELHTAIEVALSKFQSIETEQKGQQKALQASEDQFKLLVEAVIEYAIFMLDSKGRITSWNAGAERIKGYHADEVIGKHFSIFYTKDDLRNNKPNDELLIAASEGTFKEEGWRVRKGGGLYWASVVLTSLWDSKGNLRGFGQVTQDLSLKKQVQDALESSEARKAAIVNGSLDCIITMCQDGKIIEFNPAAEQVFGYKREDLIGKDMAEALIPSRLREKHRLGLDQYLSTGKGAILGKRIEMPAMRKDGTEFPAELSIVALQLKDHLIFTGFLRDITDQKIKSEELAMMLERERLANQRLKTQYDVMRVITDAKTVSEATQKLLQIIVKNLNWDLGTFWIIHEEGQCLQAIGDWHVARVNAANFLQMTRTWKCSVGVGLPGRVWKENRQTWIRDITLDSDSPRSRIAAQAGLHSAFGFPILSGQRVLGVIEFFSLEIREPDEQLLHLAATLGRQIGQFLERISAEESLRKAVRARDEFISIASHELKTPITSMKLQTQSLEHSIGRGGVESIAPERLSKALRLSTHQLNCLSRLVEDMLEISRIGTGKLKIEKDAFDLGGLVQEVIERNKDQLRSVQICPILRIEESVIGCWDRFRIDQVISNFLSNVVKYAPEKPIEVQVWKDQRTAYFSMKDYGIGIPRDALKRIFNRFERAVSATNITGLGLGLYISDHIIKSHGGAIHVESEIGKGAKFIVELPLSIPMQASQ